jgi:NAD(P)-dependent dehydrogenase (short-subunit alcohol dehydrogenase family)
VLLSSRAALGLHTRTSYSATKAGMLGMARTWALELAPEGITVNVVAPGPIRTDMFYDVVEQGPASAERATQHAAVPEKRPGRIGRRWRVPSAFFADPANMPSLRGLGAVRVRLGTQCRKPDPCEDEPARDRNLL